MLRAKIFALPFLAFFSCLGSAAEAAKCTDYLTLLSRGKANGNVEGRGCTQYQIFVISNRTWVDFLREFSTRASETSYPIKLQQAHEAFLRGHFDVALLRLDQANASSLWALGKLNDFPRAQFYSSLITGLRNISISSIIGRFSESNIDFLQNYPLPHLEYLKEFSSDEWVILKCAIMNDDLEVDFSTLLDSVLFETCLRDFNHGRRKN